MEQSKEIQIEAEASKEVKKETKKTKKEKSKKDNKSDKKSSKKKTKEPKLVSLTPNFNTQISLEFSLENPCQICITHHSHSQSKKKNITRKH